MKSQITGQATTDLMLSHFIMRWKHSKSALMMSCRCPWPQQETSRMRCRTPSHQSEWIVPPSVLGLTAVLWQSLHQGSAWQLTLPGPIDQKTKWTGNRKYIFGRKPAERMIAQSCQLRLVVHTKPRLKAVALTTMSLTWICLVHVCLLPFVLSSQSLSILIKHVSNPLQRMLVLMTVFSPSNLLGKTFRLLSLLSVLSHRMCWFPSLFLLCSSTSSHAITKQPRPTIHPWLLAAPLVWICPFRRQSALSINSLHLLTWSNWTGTNRNCQIACESHMHQRTSSTLQAYEAMVRNIGPGLQGSGWFAHVLDLATAAPRKKRRKRERKRER